MRKVFCIWPCVLCLSPAMTFGFSVLFICRELLNFHVNRISTHSWTQPINRVIIDVCINVPVINLHFHKLRSSGSRVRSVGPSSQIVNMAGHPPLALWRWYLGVTLRTPHWFLYCPGLCDFLSAVGLTSWTHLADVILIGKAGSQLRHWIFLISLFANKGFCGCELAFLQGWPLYLLFFPSVSAPALNTFLWLMLGDWPSSLPSTLTALTLTVHQQKFLIIFGSHLHQCIKRLCSFRHSQFFSVPSLLVVLCTFLVFRDVTHRDRDQQSSRGWVFLDCRYIHNTKMCEQAL